MYFDHKRKLTFNGNIIENINAAIQIQTEVLPPPPPSTFSIGNQTEKFTVDFGTQAKDIHLVNKPVQTEPNQADAQIRSFIQKYIVACQTVFEEKQINQPRVEISRESEDDDNEDNESDEEGNEEESDNDNDDSDAFRFQSNSGETIFISNPKEIKHMLNLLCMDLPRCVSFIKILNNHTPLFLNFALHDLGIRVVYIERNDDSENEIAEVEENSLSDDNHDD